MDAPKPLFDTLSQMTREPAEVGDNSGVIVDDYRYAHLFLYSYRGSHATFSSYRREIERFLHWTWKVAGKSLNSVKRDDIERYIEFSQSPPPNWLGNKQVPRFVELGGERLPNSAWRPYVLGPRRESYRPSQKALQAIFAILSSFYNFLVQEEYVALNPVALIRQKSKFVRKYQTGAMIRRLSELQWSYVLKAAQNFSHKSPEEHERTLFIISAFFGMYLRISELAASDRWQPQMNHFYKDMDGNWWFKTVGKGNKERIIAVSNAMLEALKRYRKHLGLSSLPSPSDQTPLIPKQRGTGPVASTRQLRTLVQKCFDQAKVLLTEDGFTEEAETLEDATVHWLRHTGISEDVKIRPREHVRDDAGHGSSAITDKYIDIELRERHASSKGKMIDPDCIDSDL